MATKKKYNPAFQMTEKQKAESAQKTRENMKKLGIKTLKEYENYLNKKRRGY